VSGPTGEDRAPNGREPDGRAPEERSPEQPARTDGTPDGNAAEGSAPEGDAPEPSASDAPGEGVGRHAAPADESVDEAIDSGTDVTPQIGGEGGDFPVAPAPGPRGRPPGRFLRVVRWLTSANPVVISVLSIFSALVIGAILIVIGDRPVLREFGYFFAQPGTALSGAWDQIKLAYVSLFQGAIFNPTTLGGAISGKNSWAVALGPISETLTYAAPLILTGLAVAIPFRGGLFNIGAQGQAIFGAIGAGLIGFELKLPSVLAWIIALVAGAVAGGIWGFIPGILKARTGAHEVVVTIMLNYIALLFLGWIILQGGVKDPAQAQAISKPLHSSATLPHLLGSSHRTNFGLLLGLLAALVVAWLINRSTFGFEIRAVGANPDAARTAGMSVAKTYILVMIVAGALAGLGGAVQLLGTASALTGGVVANIGFDGITVALLGRAKPWGVVLAALLFGALYAGGNQMQSNAGVVVDLVQVLQALIVIFIAAPALIMSIYRLRPGSATQATANLAKGW
jgi:general nucleoside transport system permease protein